jgi:hypothetical protein
LTERRPSLRRPEAWRPSSGRASQYDGIDVLALKRRAFERILNAEEPHLIHSKELIAGLRRCVSDIGAR